MRTLSLVKHQNVVRMVGYCIKDEYGLIVTEYMPKRTLVDVFYRQEPHLVLEWNTRYRLAFGIAQGLSYFTTIVCHKL
ncbi:conserved hypothetical protein [Ricinus communis]|uniref:Protein kinase domain-containing protein n=1 Tax=Ricinus communis TaxID=3988 RepID=B9RRI2_RICCO|nr:conserved hypothetical protein [Ricinus communis]